MNYKGYLYNVLLLKPPIGVSVSFMNLYYKPYDEDDPTKTVIIVKKVNDNSPLANYISGGDILIAINNVSYMNPTLKQFESFSDQLKTIKDSMFIQFFRLNKNGNVVYDPNAYSYLETNYCHMGPLINSTVIDDFKLLHKIKEYTQNPDSNIIIPITSLPAMDLITRSKLEALTKANKSNIDIKYNSRPKTLIFSTFHKYYRHMKRDYYKKKGIGLKPPSVSTRKEEQHSSPPTHLPVSIGIPMPPTYLLSYPTEKERSSSPPFLQDTFIFDPTFRAKKDLQIYIPSNTESPRQTDTIPSFFDTLDHCYRYSYPELLPQYQYVGFEGDYDYFKNNTVVKLPYRTVQYLYVKLQSFISMSDRSVQSYLTCRAILYHIKFSSIQDYFQLQAILHVIAYNLEYKHKQQNNLLHQNEDVEMNGTAMNNCPIQINDVDMDQSNKRIAYDTLSSSSSSEKDVDMSDTSTSKRRVIEKKGAKEDELQDDALDQVFGESYERHIFNIYTPKNVHIGGPHPSPVVESSALTGIEGPPITYKLHLPQSVIDQELLSNVQLEALIYICQKHEQISPDGYRYGFLLGDGAGIGKGREIASVIYENWCLGRKKALWISESPDLYYDACRDMSDLQADIPIINLRMVPLEKFYVNSEPQIKEGVLFMTYKTLLQKKKNPELDRFSQIVQWCGEGFDGVIVLDECHKGKNVSLSSQEDRGSQTSKYVILLQESLPNARILYSSATGASSPSNMGYMIRLGLWGSFSCFPSFPAFRQSLLRGGINMQEIVACDMKRMGFYLSRQISFHGSSFSIEKIRLNPEMREMYNRCVRIWDELYSLVEMNLKILSKYMSVQESKKEIDLDSVPDTINPQCLKSFFWASHQRFFKNLIMSFKIPRCVEVIKKALAENKSVVIGLISTGEARMSNSIKAKAGTGFVSLARETLRNMIQKGIIMPPMDNQEELKKSIEQYLEQLFHCYKVVVPGEETYYVFMDPNSDEYSHDIQNLPPLTNLPPHAFNHEYFLLYSLKLYYLSQCNQLSLPYNPLDLLIELCGGPDAVAEMTGRTYRLEHDLKTNEYKYVPRGIKRGSEAGINMVEKNAFNSGKKRIAVISDASSSGISLHCDQRFENQQKRLHIILEMPWSADKAIQQCGRTNRSNQKYSPEYVYLITDIDGENRFISSSAKRLKALGAILQGDRKASAVYNLSDYDYDTPTSRRAFRRMIDYILKAKKPTSNELPDGIDLPSYFAIQQASNELTESELRLFRSTCKIENSLSPPMTLSIKQFLEEYEHSRTNGDVSTYDKEQQVLQQFSQDQFQSEPYKRSLLDCFYKWISIFNVKQFRRGDMIKSFFNKLLGLPLYQQLLLSNYFEKARASLR